MFPSCSIRVHSCSDSCTCISIANIDKSFKTCVSLVFHSGLFMFHSCSVLACSLVFTRVLTRVEF